ESIKRLEIICKSLQTVHLGEIFAVTPVWMEDGSIRLYIVARDGGELTRVEQVLPPVKKAQQPENQQNAQAFEDGPPPKPPSDDSSSMN
ncbi:MAG: hypothetical protein K0U59_01915, partial [Gammaproteobacteria bacterium]|nr:hypothetical protein [Gammaproteobacteria bacterium]